ILRSSASAFGSTARCAAGCACATCGCEDVLAASATPAMNNACRDLMIDRLLAPGDSESPWGPSAADRVPDRHACDEAGAAWIGVWLRRTSAPDRGAR